MPVSSRVSTSPCSSNRTRWTSSRWRCCRGPIFISVSSNSASAPRTNRPTYSKPAGSYSPNDLQASRELAAATDLFYNRGRAVGVFLQLCQAIQTSPSQLLESFAEWLQKNPPSGSQPLSDVEHWQPDQILPLQQSFVAEQLRLKHKQKLLRAATDLLNYHFCCAETLLADDCLPMNKLPKTKQLRQFRWRLNPQLRIEKFNYALEELESYGGQPLESLAETADPGKVLRYFLPATGGDQDWSTDRGISRMLLAAKPAKERRAAIEAAASRGGGGVAAFCGRGGVAAAGYLINSSTSPW